MRMITPSIPSILANDRDFTSTKVRARRRPAAWRGLLPLSVLLLGAVVGSVAAAAPVALASGVELTVEAKADRRAATVADHPRFAPSDPLTDARYVASAYSTIPDGSVQALANIALATDWNGPSQGTLSWDVQAGGHNNGFGGARVAYGANRWTYRFETTVDCILSLDFSVSDDPVVGPLADSFTLTIDGVGVDVYRFRTAGLRSYRLSGAGVHEIGLRLDPYWTDLSPFEDRHYGMGAYFAWQIDDAPSGPTATVPEPAGVALVATALLAAGASRRRARQ